MNRLADEEQASKDAAMLAARDGDELLWDALIDDDKLKEKR